MEDAAETIISLYHELGPMGSNPAWNGKVARVTDPNGVQTYFEYDNWGHPAYERENPQSNIVDIGSKYVDTSTEWSPSGNAIQMANGVTCTQINYNAGGYGTSTLCGCHTFYEPGVPFAPLGAWSTEVAYDAMGRPVSMDKTVEDMQHHLTGGGHEQSERTYAMTYDAVGRPTAASITTDEPSFNTGHDPLPLLTRNHAVSYIDATGTTTYDGPDGEDIVTTTDDCSRTYQVTRSMPTGRILQTTYAYDDAGQVLTVTNGNNTTSSYTYGNE